jgi:DNA (cytosine-5)-methyltransferase 1
MSIAADAGVIERIDELLEVRYRSADLGNLDDPLAETVYILLSLQTREAVYRPTFSALRHRYPRWLDVAAAPVNDLERVLEPCGFHRQRARKLQGLLAAVERENAARGIGLSAGAQDLTLSFLHGMSDRDAERFLLALPGIGPKSARCVLSYSLDRKAFAVDTHVHRIFQRLGVVKSRGRKADHDPFQDAVPPAMRKRLHINLVHHGRAVCHNTNAKCGDCVLVSFCGRGREAVAGNDRPVAVDLFGGAGGMGSGFRAAGFRIGLAVERERHAAQTYRANNPGVPVIESTISAATSAASLRKCMPGVKRVAALLAGPPCQGYSAAGSRDPKAEINLLYKHVARLARELEAETVCLENVPGVRRVNGHGFLDAIKEELERAGYPATPHLLRACEFGVPQHRQRYFFLGRRDRGAVPRPRATHRAHGASEPAMLPETPRLDVVLACLPTVEDPGVVAEPCLDAEGRAYYNMSTMAHSPKVVEKIRAIRSGEGPISYRRLGAAEARTLIAGHRALPVHPTLDRTISVREAALIQGFGEDYIFCGPRAEQPLQVANAVPPPLAEVVAHHLLAVCSLRKQH